FRLAGSWCRRLAFFFFQAEDGIRDRNVTGVQTCALPFSFERVPETATILGAAKLTGRRASGWSLGLVDAVTAREWATVVDDSGRSEERRVGKEYTDPGPQLNAKKQSRSTSVDAQRAYIT